MTLPPYTLAIVGSTSLEGDAEAEVLIRDVLETRRELCPGLRVISGGARGIDTMAATTARAMGIPVVEYKPTVEAWLRGVPGGYWARNLLIASECDQLVRIVHADSHTYGSGWTRDRAREMGKPTEEFVVR